MLDLNKKVAIDFVFNEKVIHSLYSRLNKAIVLYGDISNISIDNIDYTVIAKQFNTTKMKIGLEIA